jgi:hypothetical protein
MAQWRSALLPAHPKGRQLGMSKEVFVISTAYYAIDAALEHQTGFCVKRCYNAPSKNRNPIGFRIVLVLLIIIMKRTDSRRIIIMQEHININTPSGMQAELPKMSRVKVNFPGDSIDDIAAVVREELDKPEIKSLIKPGMKIAVGCGSRGVANIALMAAEVVAGLKRLGAEPFVFPAMGSHGGAVAEGQTHILNNYGITEDYVGCPIVSCMDTVHVGEVQDGTPIYIDKYAAESDGIVLLNRVKPHTNFRGAVESGIVKMMTIGMGKGKGADSLHKQGFAAFGELLPEAAELIMKKAPFLFGLACVENAYHQTALIQAIPADTLLTQEAKLHDKSKELIGKLLFDEVDVLIMEQMGKDISGSGFDPNVTGRNNRGIEWDGPWVKKIVLLDLTPTTKGNATGLGLADIITRRLFDQIDFDITYTNTVSSNLLDGCAIPLICNNDREAVVLAALTVEKVPTESCKIIQLKDTNHLSEIYVSQPLWQMVEDHPNMELVGEPFEMQFDDKGVLLDSLR